MQLFTLFFLSLGVFVKESASSSSWTYSGDTGPDHWCELDLPGNQCCGMRQSPIVIEETSAIPTDVYLEFTNLDYSWDSMTLTNDGHTVVLTVPSDTTNVPKLTVHSDPDVDPTDYYLFDTLHFHFGNNDSQGSEHLINNQARPMEMHVVFYNQKYGSFVASKNYSDGIVVVGVQFQIGSRHNVKWESLLTAINQVPWYEDVTTIDPGFPLRQLLPFDLADAFTYEGSLTTPVCSEAVTWFVLAVTVQLSEIQMDHFRLLHNVTQSDMTTSSMQEVKALTPDTLMFNNFRPPQDLNGRTIYRASPQFTKRMQRLLEDRNLVSDNAKLSRTYEEVSGSFSQTFKKVITKFFK